VNRRSQPRGHSGAAILLDQRVFSAGACSVIECLLVEDEPLLRQLLGQILEAHPSIHLLGSVGNVAEAIALCQIKSPELLILDLNLPDGSGMEVAVANTTHRSDTKVIVLSAEAGCFVCPRDLRPMVCGVVDKINAFVQLPAEIDEIVADGGAE
jgi:two-component system, NarL family, nitrate/nitrite response regulator NarL